MIFFRSFFFFFVLMAQSFIHYEPYASPLLWNGMKMPIVANGMATSEREWNQLWTNSCKHLLSGGVKEIVGLFILFIIIIIICLCGF